MAFIISALTTLLFFLLPVPVFAASPDISSYTTETLSIITIIGALAAVLFFIRGGYGYITSTGKPEALESAKKTIKNAILGLLLILGSSLLVSVLHGALTGSVITGTESALPLTAVQAIKPADGLTQILIDTISSFIQNIVQSATEPLVNGVLTFLGNTPSLLSNAIIMKFWLISLGIVDGLFVLVVALLGLQLMSASMFGFEELEFKDILPRIGLAFLGANVSLFLADYAIVTCNVLVNAVLNATGGLSQALFSNILTPAGLTPGGTPLITLIFLALFLVVTIVLLFMYISRLIVISLGAVLSPFIFLLWTIPKFADFAEVAVKGYLVSVFTIFLHVVTIQLASSFLTIPAYSSNSLISVAVAIGLFFTLLKIPTVMMEMILFTSRNGAVRKIGTQIVNVMSADRPASTREAAGRAVKVPRKVVHI